MIEMMVETQSEVYELTPTQRAILIYSLYAPRSKAYFEQVCYAYQGALNSGAFQRAWQEVINRQAILRTSFSSADSEHLTQTVHANVALPYQHHDWRALTPAQQQEQLSQFLEDDAACSFDLGTPPLLRVAVLQTEDDAYWLVVSNHHIVLDGWSMSVVRREVSQLYQKLAHEKPIEIEPPRHFGEYLDWLKNRGSAETKTFWQQELAGFAEPNYLPIDKVAGKLPGANEHFAERQISLPVPLTAELKLAARKGHLTLSTVLQGAWALLLSRYCGTDDVVFGVTVSGRPYDLPGVESIVGLLINTLPLRVQIDQQESALACFKRVQRTVSGLLEHEYSSLTEIQESSEVARNLPLFETLLVFENFAGSGSSFELDGSMQLLSSHLSRTNYPLTLVVDPGEELRLQLVYHRSRFNEDAIERMLGHLGNILASLAANCEQPIGSLQLLAGHEQRQLLVEWNNTSKEFPNDLPINRLFEKQVERTPDAVALIHEDQQLTYSELNARANQLAQHLKKLGVRRESLVGICVERSIEMLVAMLATLKAGGAYVPLDPAYPKDRLAFMLNDSGVQVVLTLERSQQQLPEYRGPVVALDRDAGVINSYAPVNLDEAATSSDLAYVIYTSGSTGKPKGTLIEHGSLVNFTTAAVAEYGISPADRVLQFASLNFDTSAEEIYPALITGASVVLRTDAMISSAEDFLTSCNSLGVTLLDLPTAYWHDLTDELCAHNLSFPESARLVILGGEKALPERLANWHKRVGSRVRLVNTYGPTETTIVVTTCDLSTSEPESNPLLEVPIGRPIQNTVLYVLDRLLRPVPIGIPGQLYIGGAGVARGYLNRPELTSEKFIPNPFADERASRLYKTGDLVRYQSDGNLEFVGRIDNQVKIRGFRVELGEVERAIGKHERVSDAVVIVDGNEGGDKRLVAYVVSARSSQPSVTELREFLAAKVPAFMVPAAFVMIDALPLTPSGKIDRQALPRVEQERPALDISFAAPRSPLEESVAAVWCELLKLERVGIHDNFFELGGHSLLGAKLISNLRRTMDVKLNLIDVFQSPTIARLAQLIYQRQTEDAEEQELVILLAEIENLSDEEAEQKFAEEIAKGGPRAHALKLALIATGTTALQLLSETL